MSKRLTLTDAVNDAAARDGFCLANKYLNAQTKISWKCKEEHIWKASHASIRFGRWCAICSGNVRHSIADAQQIAEKNGGSCLSKSYQNSKIPLVWECSEGHTWEAPFNRIQQGHWCSTCGGTRKLNIQQSQEAARIRGGKCLSPEYKNASTPMLWQCSKGHKWKTSFNSIKQGSWCPQCYGNTKNSIDDARQLAHKNGGKCLSDSYNNSSTKLLWKCSKNHVWNATYNAVQSGHWCHICGGTDKLDLKKMQEIAKKNNGKCLSKIYKNGTAPLLWECDKGHQWETPYLGIISKGAWCPECRNPQNSIDNAINLAQQHGGKCLSKLYVNTKSLLEWECSDKHKWKAVYANIQQGTWCPQCSAKKNVAECRCRDILEEFTGLEFPCTRRVLGNRYELDMYNEQHQLAFEYNGSQHYIFTPQWHKTLSGLEEQQKRDKNKKKLCKEKGIALEVIHYKQSSSDTRLRSFLREKLIKHQIPLI